MTTTFKFHGMNNVSDPSSVDSSYNPAIGKNFSECVDIVNFDCDNEGGLSIRSGLVAGLTRHPVTEEMGSRNYWAIGNVVYCSKALDDTEDERYSTVIACDDMITMIRRVDGGLYVGALTELHYLNGTDPQKNGFTDTWIKEFGGVILGTGMHIRGDKVKSAGMNGNCCIFATHQGICVGGPGGNVVNLSLDKVSYPYGVMGTATIREQNGEVHYLVDVTSGNPAHNALTPLDIELI